MRKTILAILLALALVLIPVGNAFAASSVGVTVVATPAILSIDVTPLSWCINWADTAGGHSGPAYLPYGDNVTRWNTLYFSNPLGDNVTPTSLGAVGDTECLFTFTNNTIAPIKITCKMGDFVGGDLMKNGGGGWNLTPTDNVFGASAYVSNTAWPTAAVTLSYTDNLTVPSLAASPGPGNTIKWGVALYTQADAFTVAGEMNSTITCTAALWP